MLDGEVPDSDIELPPLVPDSPVWLPLGTPAALKRIPESRSRISGALDRTIKRFTLPQRHRFNFDEFARRDRQAHALIFNDRQFDGPRSDSEDGDFDMPMNLPEESQPSMPESLEPESQGATLPLHLDRKRIIESESENDETPNGEAFQIESSQPSVTRRDASPLSSPLRDASPLPSPQRHASPMIPAEELHRELSPDSANAAVPSESTDYPSRRRRHRFNFKEFAKKDKRANRLLFHGAGKKYEAPVSDSEDDDFADSDDDVENTEDTDTESSETEKDSASRVDTDSEHGVPLIERRFKTTIPAAQEPESLESLEEAIEDYGGIDFMVPRSSFNVVSLAKHAGSRASKPLRIAARTANRLRPRPRAANAPKMFANHSSETRKVLKGIANGNLNYDQVLDPPKRNKRTRRQGPPKQRRHTEQPTANFYTSIVEREEGVSKFPLSMRSPSISYAGKLPSLGSHSVGSRSLGSRSLGSNSLGSRSERDSSKERALGKQDSRAASVSSTSSKQDRVDTSRIKADINSPNRRLINFEFKQTTFIGSRLLNMFDEPGMWNRATAVPVASTFGTPVNEATEQQITEDAELIFRLCEEIDAQFLADLYAYFLAGTGFLCDEREIVELSHKRAVAREWLRLARNLLKLCLKRRAQHKLAQLALLTALASFVLSQHVGVYDESMAKRGRIFAMWALFYLQDAVSLQVDRATKPMDSTFAGVELLLAVHKFSQFDRTLPKILARTTSPKPVWHFVQLLAVSGQWQDWVLIKFVVDRTVDKDPHTVMLYIHRLLVHWKWPVSADTVIDLFNYFAKLRYYADPKGEKIGLPRFLLTSSFDGSTIPQGNTFSLFLELLGLSLRALQTSNLNLVRRLSSRVTPQSSLVFPEEREVSMADLSSASHQYGLLIVLFRALPSEMRPSIAQFRDLVVWKGAHWAMRVKAISAWDILLRLTTDGRHEFRNWMLDILDGGCYSEQVISQALTTVLPHWRPEAVPAFRLAELGLLSNIEKTRLMAWKLMGLAKFGTEDLLTLTTWQTHFGDSDLKCLISFVGGQLLTEWAQRNRAHVAPVYAQLLRSGALQVFEILPFIVDTVLKPELPRKDLNLLQAAGFAGAPKDRLRKLVFMIRGSVDLCSQAFDVADQWASELDRSALSAYLDSVSELRRLIQPMFPQLLKQPRRSAVLLDEKAKVLETMQAHILNLLHDRNVNVSLYFFIYRLRGLIIAGDPAAVADDRPYITEVQRALQIPTMESRAVTTLLHAYGLIFELTSESLMHTRKNYLPLVLPTLVRCGRAITVSRPELAEDLGAFIHRTAHYLWRVLCAHSDVSHDSYTVQLFKEFCKLAHQWLNQSSSAYKYAQGIPLPALLGPLMALVEKALGSEETAAFTPPESTHCDPQLANNLTAAFQSDTLVENYVESTSERPLRKLHLYLETFMTAYAPD